MNNIKYISLIKYYLNFQPAVAYILLLISILYYNLINIKIVEENPNERMQNAITIEQ